MKYKTGNQKSLITKIGLIFLSAYTSFLIGCGEAPANNSPTKPANTANINTSSKGNMNLAANSASQGAITMERDLTQSGRFKCKKDEEITIEFQKPNGNSTINYEYDEEKKKRKVQNDKLTFTCDKSKELHLLFNFAGSGGSFGIVFRAKSGAIIDNEEPVENPSSTIPETRHYTFLVK